jgi:putative transposase
LSQTCHGCGSVIKKPLKQRWHVCDCGVVQQRDLYSAFLATCIADDRLVVCVARERYAAIDYVLRAAASRNQSVIGQACPPNFGVSQSQNGTQRVPAAFLESLSENLGIEQLRLFPLIELC